MYEILPKDWQKIKALINDLRPVPKKPLPLTTWNPKNKTPAKPSTKRNQSKK